MSTCSGGTPYGASHMAGQNNDLELDKDELSLCRALGKRVALASLKLQCN
jgi:NAD(P)H dehydrogenase (quinone)